MAKEKAEKIEEEFFELDDNIKNLLDNEQINSLTSDQLLKIYEFKEAQKLKERKVKTDVQKKYITKDLLQSEVENEVFQNLYTKYYREEVESQFKKKFGISSTKEKLIEFALYIIMIATFVVWTCLLFDGKDENNWGMGALFAIPAIIFFWLSLTNYRIKKMNSTIWNGFKKGADKIAHSAKQHKEKTNENKLKSKKEKEEA